MYGTTIFVLFLVVAIGGGLFLYLLVRSEHDQRRVVDRETAEKVARRDTDPDDRDAERETDRFR